MKKVLLSRIYMTESEHHLEEVLKVLHDEVKIAHVIVLRGIEGFEKGGETQTSKFLSLSLSLPLVVEFFDSPDQVERAVEKIQKILKDGHILTFDANLK